MQRFRNYVITCVIALVLLPATAFNQTTPRKKSSNSVCSGKAIPVLDLAVHGPQLAEPRQRSLFQGGVLQRSRLVIRTRDEFNKFWTVSAAYKVPAPEVDFSREMIVVAAMGERPSSGYQIVIEDACEVNNRIEIFVRSMSLEKCGLHLGVLTAPVHIVRLPQTQLPVVFQETEVSDCKQASHL
jgi:hypothetical protein